MKALKVKKSEGEKVRVELIQRGLLDEMYSIARDDEFVYFPLKLTEHGWLEGRTIVDFEFKKRPMKQKTLKEMFGIQSFDVVGDIAIVEIPKELRERRNEIGEVILNTHRNIHTVLEKTGAVSDVYRVRKVEFICGEDKTETIHKEHGCRFKVDVAKEYFSPRLSHERERIAKLVNEGENVLVLFGGVAPFGIVIARNKRVNVYSIELNPSAHLHAVENVKMNKLKGTVIPIQGDVKEVLKEDGFKEWADRIVMPLPKDAVEFIPYVSHACKKGCVMHVYSIINRDKKEEQEKRILAYLSKRKAEVIGRRKVRTYSPEKDQFVWDVKLKE